MKNKFEKPELIKIIFSSQDIIVTSIGGDDDKSEFIDPEDGD